MHKKCQLCEMEVCNCEPITPQEECEHPISERDFKNETCNYCGEVFSPDGDGYDD